ETYAETLSSYLFDESLSPVKRLRHYVESKKNDLLNQSCRKGCLIGNLSQEMADQSEVLRVELARVMARWRELYARCIEEGQKLGEINNKFPASQLAEMFLCGWEGGIMRSKTQKNVEPLEAFIEVMFNQVLKP
ncbi:MAG: TetR family transcriptional regulator C-terminal domain-containing protein, partial [Candidatus Obscuribacterales bacterium]|nr:TetR family transcriptional regulator C-terminal domain-containing protein [Candidatus Obscuribacterales bacterium]